MKIRAQVTMVLNLDKCIGCHTCSVTCKNVWTNRPGMEYVWFNNVETKPSVGYPKRWEDQEKWQGGWQLDGGKLKLKRGPRPWLLAGIFSNGYLPTIDEYYEPYTFDYQKLQKAPLMKTSPTAQPISYITGEVMDKVKGSAAWEDDLGGVDVEKVNDINLNGVQREIYAKYANTFMFYLPRLCNHCLNPGCVASCPSGSIYKREEDGIVLVDQDKCRGWRMCMTGCPYKKVYYNWSSGKAEKCIFCYPRIESGCPTVCSESCTGRIRYVGVVLYDADKIKKLASTENEEDLYEAQRSVFLDPFNLDVIEEARAAGISDEWIKAAQNSPVYKLIKWGVAFPMHPEYRTLPMVWYVPPLSPITDALDSGQLSMDGMLPKVDELRIPIQYLANLLAGGNTKVVQDALARLLLMRSVVRHYSNSAGLEQYLQSELPLDAIKEVPGVEQLHALGLTPEDICEMHSLLAIANYEDRFVIPTANRDNEASVLQQGEQGMNMGGGRDQRYRASRIFGGPMDRKISPLFKDYEMATQPRKQK